MESPIPEKEKCPSFETLSAVFDRECSEEAVLSHVRECEICQKTLKELEGLERALKLALERETPADLSERILAGFHDREKARERKFTIHPGTLHFARAAALIAVLALVVCLLSIGLPIFDTLCAMLRRAATHKPIMQADRGHLHHKLIDRGYTQKQAVLIMYGISLVLAILAIIIAIKDSRALAVAVLMVILLSFVIFVFNNKTRLKEQRKK